MGPRLIALFLILIPPAAFAHDIWINNGGHRNPAGEWCCGVGDCGVVSSGAVRAVGGGYILHGAVVYGQGATGNAKDGPTHTEQLNESIPYSQALPSPDGSFWRCKSPIFCYRNFLRKRLVEGEKSSPPPIH